MSITFKVDTEAKLLLKPGQKVDFKTPLYKLVSTQDAKIYLAQKMQIPPQNIFIHMTKVVGDEIKKGDVLAKKKTLFSERAFVSEHSGLIKLIDHQEGVVIVSSQVKKEDVKYSFFKGEVEEVKKSEIKLKVDKDKSFKIKSATADFGGEVFFPKSDSLDRLAEDQIEGKVLFIKNLPSFIRTKFEVMGILGFVTSEDMGGDGTIPQATLKEEEDLDNIKDLGYPYCLVSKGENTIHLYE